MTKARENEFAISEEALEKVRRKDISNLLKKVNSGKPLTGPQMSRLMQYAEPVERELDAPSIVTNIAALCTALGVSRPTFYKYRKRKDAPKKAANGVYDLNAWRLFLSRHGVLENVGQGDEPEDLAEQKRRKEVEQLQLRCALLRLEYDRRKGTQVPVDEVVEFIRTRGSFTRKRVLSMPTSLAPQLANRSAKYIVDRLKTWSTTFLRDVREFEPKERKGKEK